jgi:hypothetical protein
MPCIQVSHCQHLLRVNPYLLKRNYLPCPLRNLGRQDMDMRKLCCYLSAR